MSRIEEYNDILKELDSLPPALEYSLARASARAKKAARVRRYLTFPASGLAALFIVFVIMVNVSAPFALACGRISFLRELAAAVSLSPSLSAAVENEYVQPIGLEQSVNGITMRIEHVIVDQKQLNIFYSLDSEEYFHMDASPTIKNTDGTSLEGYSINSGSHGAQNGDLRQFTVDFIDNDVPDSLILTCRVHDNGAYQRSEALPPEPVQADDLLTQTEFTAPEAVSIFTFTLEFDPDYTQQGETITLNQEFLLDDQRLIIMDVEIYPTHMRLNFDDFDENTAWLKSLDFYIENEKRERFEAIGNGITATGKQDSPMLASHRLESSFFSESKSLTLHITGAVWLDKTMERVKIDLANRKADALPEGVALDEAERRNGNWYLTFSAVEFEKNHSYQLFGHDYYDESGNDYMYNSSSTVSMDGYYDEQAGEYVEMHGRFNNKFALTAYPYDIVYLSPSYSRRVTLNEPVALKVK